MDEKVHARFTALLDFAGFDGLRLLLITFINGLWGVGLPILCVLLARTGLFKSA